MVTERVRCRQPALNPVSAAVAAQVTVDGAESAVAAAAESLVGASVARAIAALVGKLLVEADELCAVVAGVGVARVASAEHAPQARAAPAQSRRYSHGRFPYLARTYATTSATGHDFGAVVAVMKAQQYVAGTASSSMAPNVATQKLLVTRNLLPLAPIFPPLIRCRHSARQTNACSRVSASLIRQAGSPVLVQYSRQEGLPGTRSPG
mmetsp:Transcript_7332/g.10949  ORF Transcript_7332/g.10949 Transcript_7332/m.10949 type:complete len:208 (+) Transcript_7332:209-832(+)